MLPYLNSTRKTERDTVAFGGINYGEGAGEGELSESAGLSSASYPALSPRAPRKVEREYYQKPDAVFAWNKLVEVSGGLLKYDGRDMCTVSEGEKQFAVVANKLVVFPDKLVLDLLQNPPTCHHHGAEVKSFEGSPTSITANGITITENPRVDAGSGERTYRLTTSDVLLVTYTSAQWQDGEWVLEGREEKSLFDLEVGDIMIPYKLATGGYSENVWWVQRFTNGTIDRSPNGYKGNNSDGVYWKVTSVTKRGLPGPYEDDGPAYAVGSNGKINAEGKVSFTCDAYSATDTQPKLSDKFAVVDVVRVQIAGDDTDKRLVVASVGALSITFTTSSLKTMVTQNVVTIKHDVPDLDYICAKDNRLWGVCSATQTIHASSLGKPMDFAEYVGVDTDSYYAEVGSAGEFTGITAYSDSVLIWKENLLYKVLGANPSDYRYYEYAVSGVQQGCNASQTIINEVLYFLGREGVPETCRSS